MKILCLIMAAGLFAVSCGSGASSSSSASNTIDLSYPIVATGQVQTFDNYDVIPAPMHGEAFYGQDAQFIVNEMSYTDNGDGTISDNNTGLMWQKGYKILDCEQALVELERLNKEDQYSDWRMPTIKELYSIMNFSGIDVAMIDFDNPDVGGEQSEGDRTPFINTDYFDFEYGANGERPIDTQLLSSTFYTSTTIGGAKTVFGLNVADGRIKGYGVYFGNSLKPFTVRFVRGNKDYGINKFVDNKDNTITDEATGLMWTKDDSQNPMSWEEAFAYVQKLNDEKYLGYSDWRVPNAKELHSILDYSRNPKTTGSAAIDPIFNATLTDIEAGRKDYGYYWTSTTHENGLSKGRPAVYMCFGESLGFLTVGGRGFSLKEPEGEAIVVDGVNYYLVDVHGAGSQRSDPKTADVSDFPHGLGPQGDNIRVYNMVRVVRTFS